MKRLVSFLALSSVILGTSAAFADPPAKLLLKELMAGPTQAEHVVITNPGTTSVALDPELGFSGEYGFDPRTRERQETIGESVLTFNLQARAVPM